MRVGERYKEGRYVVQRKLGWGHFSTVWLVSDTATGGEAALKVMVPGRLSPTHLPVMLSLLISGAPSILPCSRQRMQALLLGSSPALGSEGCFGQRVSACKKWR